MTGKFSKDVVKAALGRFASGEYQRADLDIGFASLSSAQFESSIALLRQLCLEGFLKESNYKNGWFAITQKGKDFLNG